MNSNEILGSSPPMQQVPPPDPIRHPSNPTPSPGRKAVSRFANLVEAAKRDKFTVVVHAAIHITTQQVNPVTIAVASALRVPPTKIIFLSCAPLPRRDAAWAIDPDNEPALRMQVISGVKVSVEGIGEFSLLPGRGPSPSGPRAPKGSLVVLGSNEMDINVVRIAIRERIGSELFSMRKKEASSPVLIDAVTPEHKKVLLENGLLVFKDNLVSRLQVTDPANKPSKPTYNQVAPESPALRAGSAQQRVSPPAWNNRVPDQLNASLLARVERLEQEMSERKCNEAAMQAKVSIVVKRVGELGSSMAIIQAEFIKIQGITASIEQMDLSDSDVAANAQCENGIDLVVEDMPTNIETTVNRPTRTGDLYASVGEFRKNTRPYTTDDAQINMDEVRDDQQELELGKRSRSESEDHEEELRRLTEIKWLEVSKGSIGRPVKATIKEGTFRKEGVVALQADVQMATLQRATYDGTRYCGAATSIISKVTPLAMTPRSILFAAVLPPPGTEGKIPFTPVGKFKLGQTQYEIYEGPISGIENEFEVIQRNGGPEIIRQPCVVSKVDDDDYIICADSVTTPFAAQLLSK